MQATLTVIGRPNRSQDPPYFDGKPDRRRHDPRPLDRQGGWTLDCELEAVAIPDRSGRPFIVARVPKIERRFASRMHTVAGMAPRLGTLHESCRSSPRAWLPTGRLAERSGAPTAADAMRQAIVSCLHESARADPCATAR